MHAHRAVIGAADAAEHRPVTDSGGGVVDELPRGVANGLHELGRSGTLVTGMRVLGIGDGVIARREKRRAWGNGAKQSHPQDVSAGFENESRDWLRHRIFLLHLELMAVAERDRPGPEWSPTQNHIMAKLHSAG